MKVTRRTLTGLYVTEEMTREEYKIYRIHREVNSMLLVAIFLLTMLCGAIWFTIFLGL